MTFARGLILTLILVLGMAVWSSPALGCQDQHLALEGPSYHWDKKDEHNNLNYGIGADCMWRGLRWGASVYENTQRHTSFQAAAAKAIWGPLSVFLGAASGYSDGLIPFGGVALTFGPVEIVQIPGDDGGVTHLRWRIPLQ